MQYKIHTAPIWEAFEEKCDCPICHLEQVVSDRLVSQYLNEAVMEPSYRIDVNKYGFCPKHLTDLYEGENKLGLALQIHTHTHEILQNLCYPRNVKQAKNEAKRLSEILGTCIICNQQNDSLKRYCSAVAQMYHSEPDFPALFQACNGFCLKHYVQLLAECDYAASSAQSYINALFLLFDTKLKNSNSDLSEFIDHFDYQKRSDFTEKDFTKTLPKSINKLKGRLIILKK